MSKSTIQLLSETVELIDGKPRTILTWAGSKAGVAKVKKTLTDGGLDPGFTISTRICGGTWRLTLSMPGMHKLPPLLLRI